jgi:hypothetical protein
VTLQLALLFLTSLLRIGALNEVTPQQDTGIEGKWRICITRMGKPIPVCGNAEVTRMAGGPSEQQFGVTHDLPLDVVMGNPGFAQRKFGAIGILGDSVLRISIGTFAPGGWLGDGGDLGAHIPWPRDKVTGRHATDSIWGLWGQSCRGGCVDVRGSLTMRRPLPGLVDPPPARAIDSNDIRYVLRSIVATKDPRVAPMTGDTLRVLRMAFNRALIDSTKWLPYRQEFLAMLHARPMNDQDERTIEVSIVALEISGDMLLSRYSIGDRKRCPRDPWMGGGTAYQLVAHRTGTGWGTPDYQVTGIGDTMRCR